MKAGTVGRIRQSLGHHPFFENGYQIKEHRALRSFTKVNHLKTGKTSSTLGVIKMIRDITAIIIGFLLALAANAYFEEEDISTCWEPSTKDASCSWHQIKCEE